MPQRLNITTSQIFLQEAPIAEDNIAERQTT